MVNRRNFLHTSASISAGMAFPFISNAANRDSKPNIIFIMADDLGYGHLGCYGQKKIRTPFLDQMAEEGIRFTQCYSGAPVCAPSRSVLMTGLHGGHTPVRGNSGGIPFEPGEGTVAETLQEAGYTTGLFGKWGLGEHGTTGVPYKQGFDEFFGWLHQIHAHFYYPTYLWHNDQKYWLKDNDGFSGQYAHDVVMKKAMDFVKQNAKKPKPFFLYLPFCIPHYELLVPEDSLEEYRGEFPETAYTGRREKVGYPHDYAAQSHPKAAIAAMITRMDRNLGRLFALLKELGIEDNTLIFFTSDNGPSYGPGDPQFFNASGGLRGVKTSLYEGGIRVPMIAKWPGRIQAGSTTEHPCYFPDVMPTLADIAEIDPPANHDGLSFANTLLGYSNQPKHDVMYWEMGEDKRAVRFGDWKAVQSKREETGERFFELYNLAEDMGERRNLAYINPDIVEQAKRLMEQEHEPMRPQIEPEPPEGRQYQ